MANVLLGVTGSVAAIRTPLLFEQLRASGHAVKVVATQAALYFFDSQRIQPASQSTVSRNRDYLILDEDEWPGKDEGRKYDRADPVLHIELRRWADLLIIAPLDANTLGKIANGLADNCLTCVYRAWDVSRPIILAPAMNTMMWDHPVTGRLLRMLARDCGAGELEEGLSNLQLCEHINQRASKLIIVPPQSKRLACDDIGLGAMAEVDAIVALANRLAGG